MIGGGVPSTEAAVIKRTVCCWRRPSRRPPMMPWSCRHWALSIQLALVCRTCV